VGLYPRFARDRLLESLEDSPAVLIHGPRQCGKTTLARRVGDRLGHAYFTFDDPAILAAARADPAGFVADLPERSTLDEVQRVPELFPTLKLAIDRRRASGRYLLTGSANVLLVPTLAESLAGRMSILRLHPLAQSELRGRKPAFLDTLLAGRFRVRSWKRLGGELAERITAGGYPAALARSPGRRRSAWYRDYVETLVQRDVRDLSRIRSFEALPRLLSVAAGQTARSLNVTDLGAPFQLSRPTIREYVTLLERVFLLEELPPWHTNRLTRLVKSPKLHVGDTGIACALLGLDAAALDADRALLGQLAETFVYQELRRQASWHPGEIGFHHYRDRDGAEVDIVVENGRGQVFGVEVKVAASVGTDDFRALRKLGTAAGRRMTGGVVLYDGEVSVGFGDRLYAVPMRELWDPA
jgi:hypothetical protein